MRRTCLSVTALSLLSVAQAAELSGYATLTSDYVKRGVSQSDGHAAVQLAGDVGFESGWFVGVWGSSVDIGNGPGRQRDREVNAYAGYGRNLDSAWRLSATAVAYFYPGQTGNVDYDYFELSVAANYDDVVWVELAYSPDLYHSGRETWNLEALGEWPLRGAWSFSAGAGYYDVSALSGTGYGYWQAGATGRFRYAELDIRLHDTNRDVFIVSTPDRTGSRVALTMTIPF